MKSDMFGMDWHDGRTERGGRERKKEKASKQISLLYTHSRPPRPLDHQSSCTTYGFPPKAKREMCFCRFINFVMLSCCHVPYLEAVVTKVGGLCRGGKVSYNVDFLFSILHPIRTLPSPHLSRSSFRILSRY